MSSIMSGLKPGSRLSGSAPEHFSTGHDGSRLSPGEIPLSPKGERGGRSPFLPLSRLREGPGEGRDPIRAVRSPVDLSV